MLELFNTCSKKLFIVKTIYICIVEEIATQAKTLDVSQKFSVLPILL